jgi:hypothetical protein
LPSAAQRSSQRGSTPSNPRITRRPRSDACPATTLGGLAGSRPGAVPAPWPEGPHPSRHPEAVSSTRTADAAAARVRGESRRGGDVARERDRVNARSMAAVYPTRRRRAIGRRRPRTCPSRKRHPIVVFSNHRIGRRRAHTFPAREGGPVMPTAARHPRRRVAHAQLRRRDGDTARTRGSNRNPGERLQRGGDNRYAERRAVALLHGR